MIRLLVNPDDKQALDAFIAEYGVDAVDRDGRTFLMSAVAKNNLELVSYLIGKNYDLSATDNQGMTALHMAAIHDFPEVAELLLDHGAEIDPTDAWGNTPLWRAAMNSPEQNSATANLLLARGADAGKENNSGVAPSALLHN
ncbi:ankyrin repeat domain-containing protein [Enemella sp. A6]|uniref:ankyrin repeat domain-containing protein n=1 Tax=Enemella sp. A6 TaxID=3440152 RepID=UPI003EBD94CA